MFLFVQQWEIRKGKENDYTNFVLQKHLPAMNRMGLKTIGGFHVMIGSGPRMASASLADDFLSMQKAVQSEEFIEITKEFFEYIYNYSNAVLKDTGRVDMAHYSLSLGMCRFNQYFKLAPRTEKDYAEFLKNDYIPKLAEIGIRIQAEWQVIIGDTMRLLLEGVAASSVDIAKAIMTDEYRGLKRNLLTNFANNYSCRILAPTGRVEIAYLLDGMMKAL
jgi:hypothetical protein